MSSALRSTISALVLVIVILVAVTPVPALAASSYLCHGYTPCAAQGYSHAGYQQAAKQKYWLMYAGHNCTNYVAYRMVSQGLPNSRPWSGTGNAYNWGKANAAKTDLTPVVGGVAWWKANVTGGGRSGHVAYVEQVISADEIIVSEDHWGGDFDWRRIKRSSGWPSGFVHFKDAAIGSARGHLDAASMPSRGKLSVTGWAFDPDKTSNAVSIRVYVGGPPGVGKRYSLKTAQLSRPDVAKAYPNAGAQHGFQQTIKITTTSRSRSAGQVDIYVYGVNVSKTPGISALLGRSTIKVK